MQDQQIALLHCEFCEDYEKHELLFTSEGEVAIRDVDGGISRDFASYYLFACSRCANVSLNIWSPYHEPGAAFGERVYPPAVSSWSELPITVRSAYFEARKVKYCSAVAFAVMARRVVEAIVEENGIPVAGLADGIRDLADKTQLPMVYIEIAELVRKIGNRGAHSMSVDIDAIMVEFVDGFLADIFRHLYGVPSSLRAFHQFMEDGGDSIVGSF